MKKVILYIAESLDGFVASKDGNVAWLDRFNDPRVDYGMGDFMERIDTVVQGNTTYQQFKPTYEGKNSYVFTREPEKYSEEGVNFIKGKPHEFIEGLDEERHQNIWLVGGPELLTGFLNEEQVDELIIFIMPVLLNEGIRLFTDIKKHPQLTLTDSKSYDNGVVELHYMVT